MLQRKMIASSSLLFNFCEMVTCQLKVSALEHHLLIPLKEAAQMLAVHFLRGEETLFPFLHEHFLRCSVGGDVIVNIKQNEIFGWCVFWRHLFVTFLMKKGHGFKVVLCYILSSCYICYCRLVSLIIVLRFDKVNTAKGFPVAPIVYKFFQGETVQKVLNCSVPACDHSVAVHRKESCSLMQPCLSGYFYRCVNEVSYVIQPE